VDPPKMSFANHPHVEIVQKRLLRTIATCESLKIPVAEPLLLAISLAAKCFTL
jgi:hypothetical protein